MKNGFRRAIVALSAIVLVPVAAVATLMVLFATPVPEAAKIVLFVLITAPAAKAVAYVPLALLTAPVPVAEVAVAFR